MFLKHGMSGARRKVQPKGHNLELLPHSISKKENVYPFKGAMTRPPL